MFNLYGFSLGDIGLIVTGIISIIYAIFRLGKEYNEYQNTKKKVNETENRVNAIHEDVTFMKGFFSKRLDAKQPKRKAKINIR
ncbi:MAG: hypothetical protein KAJ91_03875 [Candidatus Aenigmarchaeota archaeon]|nr:hypothetical protein [Candidatus Aenigmarchaeota archaeon]